MKLKMTDPNVEGISSKCSEKTFPTIEENKKTESPILDSSKNEPSHDVIGIEEKIINDSAFAFAAKQTKEMSMKLTITCDTTMQATSPYASSISNTASVHLTRDPLRISTTPPSSSGSLPKSEILTFTTNYNDRSPDTHSTLVDIVDRHDPPSILNRVPQLSIEEAFHLPRSSLPSIGSSMNHIRQPRRIWSIRKCLCCTLPIDEEIDTLPHSRGAPPTYSSIYAGPSAISQEALPTIPRPHLPDDRGYIFPSMNQSSFVAPIPPPSYAQAQGLQLGPYSVEQSLSVSPSNSSWPPRSVATICPRCIALVVTITEVRRSAITHLSAFLLCLCGCWPCCMIPYCLDSCKSIDHYCPVCRTYLGTYTPW